jgi:hypothetical protein
LIVILLSAAVFAPIWKSRSAPSPLSSFLQFAELLLQAGAVVSAVRRVARLHRQFAHALQRVADLADRPLGRLRQRHGVVGVAHGHVHAAHLRLQAFGDGEAGGVVLGAVDAQARGQALHRGGLAGLAGREIALRVQRHHVGVDGRSHDETPLRLNMPGSGAGLATAGPFPVPPPSPGCRPGTIPAAARR